MHNQFNGLGGNLANFPVKIREFLCQFQVVIAMIMMTTTLRFVVFKIGHKAHCGDLRVIEAQSLKCRIWLAGNTRFAYRRATTV